MKNMKRAERRHRTECKKKQRWNVIRDTNEGTGIHDWKGFWLEPYWWIKDKDIAGLKNKLPCYMIGGSWKYHDPDIYYISKNHKNEIKSLDYVEQVIPYGINPGNNLAKRAAYSFKGRMNVGKRISEYE